MKKFFKKIGLFLVFLIICISVFGIMAWVSFALSKDSIFLQYLVFFCIIAAALILIISLFEFSNAIKENYRNFSNARTIQFWCFVALIIMLGAIMWQKEPNQSPKIINLIEYIVSTVTITGIFTLIQNFLHPGTIQIKIWGTPSYEKNRHLCISSNFSVNLHNYNKKAQKVSLLGICLKEDKNKILKDKDWDKKLYLPDTLSTRINKVPSCDDFESVLSEQDSESYRINKEDMLVYLKGKTTVKKDYTDLCIVYYVVDNPVSTSNLITKHFRVEN